MKETFEYIDVCQKINRHHLISHVTIIKVSKLSKFNNDRKNFKNDLQKVAKKLSFVIFPVSSTFKHIKQKVLNFQYQQNQLGYLLFETQFNNPT